MSGDFPRFQLDHLREWFSVHPGDSSPKNQADYEAIRARNAACTPIPATHIAKEWVGANGGETGV